MKSLKVSPRCQQRITKQAMHKWKDRRSNIKGSRYCRPTCAIARLIAYWKVISWGSKIRLYKENPQLQTGIPTEDCNSVTCSRTLTQGPGQGQELLGQGPGLISQRPGQGQGLTFKDKESYMSLRSPAQGQGLTWLGVSLLFFQIWSIHLHDISTHLHTECQVDMASE